MYKALVMKYDIKYTITELRFNKSTIKYHKCEIYSVDVTFEHTNRPSGNHDESKYYFSNDQKSTV